VSLSRARGRATVATLRLAQLHTQAGAGGQSAQPVIIYSLVQSSATVRRPCGVAKDFGLELAGVNKCRWLSPEFTG
jgi:hypothetical protein